MARISEHGLPLMLLLVTLAFWAGLMALALRSAALLPTAAGTVVAVFPTATAPEAMYRAVLNAEGRLVNTTWLASAWVVHSDQANFVQRLQQQGAWAVFKPTLFQPLMLGGCFLVAPRNG